MAFAVLGVHSTSVSVTGVSPSTVVGDVCTLLSSFGNNSAITGDVTGTAISGTATAFGSSCTVSGGIFTGGGGVSLGVPPVSTGLGIFTSGPLAEGKVSFCADAANFAASVAGIVANAAATNASPSSIFVGTGATQTFPNVVAGALNVFKLTSLQVSSSAKLLIPGDASTTVVINVSGTFRVKRLGRIQVTGGMLAERLIINVSDPGGTATLERDARMDGTLLAVERDISIGSHAIVNGAVIGGENAIGIGTGALIDRKAFVGPLP